MKLPQIKSIDDILDIVAEFGFLPFFKCNIEGLSVEEACAPELWFSDSADGPWEWKGPIARTKKCAYGKFFGGRAGFINLDIFPDFANYRRDGYDFDARCDDGLAPHSDIAVYSELEKSGEIVSRALKANCGFSRGGRRGFDGIITRLQMQTYAVISDFIYEVSRSGKTYGWGVACYSTPENLFGKEIVTAAYSRDGKESFERIVSRLTSAGGISPQDAEKLLR